MVKQLLLLLPLTLASVPVNAQQVNNFGVCTQYREVYQPGYYDQYGNYVQGGVNTQSFNVPCNQISSGSGYVAPNTSYNNGYVGRATNPNCNPARTLLGATFGGAVGRAASSNYPKNYGWATALGASIGGLIFAC
jgi:hypothetical protein